MRKEKKPNPQGKGHNSSIAVLQEVSAYLGLPDLKDDSEKKIVQDYLSSLFVISCDFKFSPVRGREYYIYSHNDRLLLSLISPAEGGKEIYEKHLGSCCLRDDFTWALLFAEKAYEGGGPLYSEQAGCNTIDELERRIRAGEVGRYDSSLGYYQNVLNYGLGKGITLRKNRLTAIEADKKEKPERLPKQDGRIAL